MYFSHVNGIFSKTTNVYKFVVFHVKTHLNKIPKLHFVLFIENGFTKLYISHKKMSFADVLNRELKGVDSAHTIKNIHQ